MAAGAEKMRGAYEETGEPQRKPYRIVSARDSLSLPPVEFRVDGILPMKGTTAFVGGSGDGKGLTTLDMFFGIATDTAWRSNHDVQQCAVAVFVAEAFPGMPQRVRAQFDHRRIPIDTDVPIYLIPAAPKLNLRDDRQRAIDTLGELPQIPGVVAFDTLQRTLDGDENTTKDMGAYCDGLQAIAEAIDGNAATLHHTGWDKSRERGNSALRASVDMMIMVARDERVVTMSCLKPRDVAEFAPLRFRITPHLDSAVVVPIDEGDTVDSTVTPRRLRDVPRAARTVLETLRDSFGDEGASASLLQRTSAVNERGFYRALRDLRRWGFITKAKQCYQLSLAGREVMT